MAEDLDPGLLDLRIALEARPLLLCHISVCAKAHSKAMPARPSWSQRDQSLNNLNAIAPVSEIVLNFNNIHLRLSNWYIFYHNSYKSEIVNTNLGLHSIV